MKIVDKIKRATKPSFAFEIVPSSSGSSLRDILETVEFLMPHDPQWINVTSHSQNAIEVCGAIQNHFRVTTVAHLLCRGFSVEHNDEALDELNSLGVQNVLLLQGEAPEAERKFKSGSSFNQYAADLVKQVSYSAFNFCIGVAGYPEKHIAAVDLQTDIAHLKKKVDSGAHYIITQMFFDNQRFYDFVAQCRQAGIQVPIIPGLRVLTGEAQLTSIPKHFHCSLPPALVEGVLGNPDEAAETGRRWAEAQARDLLAHEYPILHFFVLNNMRPVKQLVESLSALTNR